MKRLVFLLVPAALLLSGCASVKSKVSDWTTAWKSEAIDKIDAQMEKWLSSNGSAEPAETPEASEPASSEAWPAELIDVRWLHSDVRSWAVTTVLDPSVRGGKIGLSYDKAKTWPERNGVNANPWVIVKWTDGKWYAATWEWLRFGQTSKDMGGKSWGGHIKRNPLSAWEPSSGETVYFMVSGLARDKTRNAQERSGPVKIVWP